MNQPWPTELINVQFREKRPLLLNPAVWKTTKSVELDEVIVGLGEVQNSPSNDEFELEPSYSDTLS